MSDRKRSPDSLSDLSEQKRSDSFMGDTTGKARSAGDAENPQDGQDIPRSSDARPRGKTEDPDRTL